MEQHLARRIKLELRYRHYAQKEGTARGLLLLSAVSVERMSKRILNQINQNDI